MSETPRDPMADGCSDGRQPDDVFSDLRDRPTQELGSGALWRRIEAQLAPRSVSRWSGRLFGIGGQRAPAMRLAYGLAAIAGIAGIALAGWMASTLITAPAEESQFVMLTPVEPRGAPAPGQGAPATSTTGPMHLDIRLLRGYDGAPPEEMTSASLSGVGGADVLYDVRADIEIMLPFESYGIVGSWRGSVTSGAALDIELADDYRLVAGLAETISEPSDVLRLNALELVGAGLEFVAADMRLEAGRLYVLGVVAAGAETPDLILLIRAEGAAQER
jgi:hypothetical protein